jgi:hypothetical protein
MDEKQIEFNSIHPHLMKEIQISEPDKTGYLNINDSPVSFAKYINATEKRTRRITDTTFWAIQRIERKTNRLIVVICSISLSMNPTT